MSYIGDAIPYMPYGKSYIGINKSYVGDTDPYPEYDYELRRGYYLLFMWYLKKHAWFFFSVYTINTLYIYFLVLPATHRSPLSLLL